nr:ATP-binding cassette domain-containing protein [Paracraurococcus ruber]
MRGVGHGFGSGPRRRTVLRGIDLDLRAGEFVALTGPSGSGKTTLLTLLGALRVPEAGRVCLLGQDMAGLDAAGLAALRRRIGFVFQRHHLLRSLSVLENVEAALHALPGAEPRRDRAAALAMLEAVGLGGRGAEPTARLSGGEQQRVAVARALVRRPALVLADEPTASLDGGTGRAVVALLADLARSQGCAVVMGTHDERCLDLVTRRLHMEDGMLRQTEQAA